MGVKCINFVWGGGGCSEDKNLQISDLQRLASLIFVTWSEKGKVPENNLLLIFI